MVIVGGGWSGCAAAIAARQAGVEQVVLLERTDSLLGAGLVGGIMRNNGRYAAAEEMIALGGGALFEVCDANSCHRNLEFPGHKHASMYDVRRIEHAVRKRVLSAGVEVWLQARVNGLTRRNGSIAAVTLENSQSITGDVFIDSTGSCASQSFCTEYGNGCVMCVMRCPTFGPRTSLTGLAGIVERQGRKPDGSLGAMSGACELAKDSIAPEVVAELEARGVLVLPLPATVVDEKEARHEVLPAICVGRVCAKPRAAAQRPRETDEPIHSAGAFAAGARPGERALQRSVRRQRRQLDALRSARRARRSHAGAGRGG